MLNPQRQGSLGIQVILIAISAAAEAATLGAVVPFLALLSSQNQDTFFLSFANVNLNITSAACLFIIIALFGMCIRIAAQRYAVLIAFGIGADLADRVYVRVLQQPYSWHSKNSSSAILASLTKVNQIVSGVVNPILQGFVAALASTGIIIAIVIVDPILAVLSATFIGLFYIGAMFAVRRTISRNSILISANENLRIQAMQEGLGGIREVILEGTRNYFSQQFDNFNRKSRDAQALNNILSTLPRYFIETFAIIFIVIYSVLIISSAEALNKAIPALGALALGGQRLLPQLQAIYVAWTGFKGNFAQLADVIELAELPENEEASSGHQHQESANKDPILVRMDNVTFAHDIDAVPVLKGISIAIPRGARVGIIGKTGCGKTTMVDIMLGLLVPNEGRVFANGRELVEENRGEWQRRVSHVPQQIFLADTSISQNIAFGREIKDIEVDSVIRAARMAQLHEFISGLESGYDTKTGERGVRLSGGQRQRIGLARALYRNADLLVLDEATSALDDKTEAEVMETIANLGREITIIMIAHRLSTLRGCDLIIELEEGCIKQLGTPQEVLPPQAAPRTAAAIQSQ